VGSRVGTADAGAELGATDTAPEPVLLEGAEATLPVGIGVPVLAAFVAAALLLQAANANAAATIAIVLVAVFRRRRVLDTCFLHVLSNVLVDKAAPYEVLRGYSGREVPRDETAHPPWSRARETQGQRRGD
jgi:hypothetical protein